MKIRTPSLCLYEFLFMCVLAETCFSWKHAMKSFPLIKVGILLTATLAHRAAISPPYGGSSEHAIGSEDRGGFRVRRQGCGWCRGTLRHAHRRRAFGQCCLGERYIRHQIDLKKQSS